MWVPLFDLNIIFWNKTQNITLENVTVQHGTLNITCNNNNMLINNVIYNDFITQYIVYHYFITMKDPNRLINIIDGICYIETDHIQTNINTPIFNMLCTYYILQNNNIGNGFDIKTINIIPNIKISKSVFSTANNKEFNIKLFDYQKKSIMRMLQIEKNQNMSVDFNLEIKMDKHTIKWDPVRESIAHDDSNIGKIRSNGGVLADIMGLGKTITMLGLIHYGENYSPIHSPIHSIDIQPKKLYSRATLIIVPSHLAKQWNCEINRVFTNKKTIMILNKLHHENTTYEDIESADIVIVTFQFLSNSKHYGILHYKAYTPSQFRLNERKECIEAYFTELLKLSYKTMTAPLFEYFHFNRMIVDEGHELMESLNHNHPGKLVNRFMYDFITSTEASYKWYVSGTPFTTRNGVDMLMQFLNIKLRYKKHTYDIRLTDTNYPNIDFIAIKNDSVLLNILRCFTIRHLQHDVANEIKLLGYKENVVWVDMTEGEKRIYESKAKNCIVDRKTLLQICCHPLISQDFRKIAGDMTSLADVEDQIIQHHKNVIKKKTKQIANLDMTNQAYHMLLRKYNMMISESRYMLDVLEKIQNEVEFNEDTNCNVCFDTMLDPVLTPCGHIFCETCIKCCIDIKPECPLCKNNITSDKLLYLNKVEKPNDVNPLVTKYGAKLGKLIQMVRTLLSQDARIIIFSQWDDMLSLIKQSMINNGIACSFITGNVYQRAKAISRFKLGEENHVILLSLNKSASGTNLTEATHIFFVEPIDDTKENITAIESQAIARAVRMGQTQTVEIVRILCRDTIEEEIHINKYQ